MSSNEIVTGTQEQKITPVQLANRIIQRKLNHEQAEQRYAAEQGNDINIILQFMAADPNNPLLLTSGLIDHLALVDDQFIQYKRT